MINLKSNETSRKVLDIKLANKYDQKSKVNQIKQYKKIKKIF